MAESLIFPYAASVTDQKAQAHNKVLTVSHTQPIVLKSSWLMTKNP